jgi:hypothetical protein
MARAQAPAPAGTPPAGDDAPALPKAAGADDMRPDGSRAVIDLSHRYRFAEQYSSREGTVPPGVVGPYRVTVKETTKETGNTADPAAKTEVTSREIEYVERAAEVSGLGAVTATIRTFALYRTQPEETAAQPGARLLDGLTVWNRPRRDAAPLVISLEGRQLREREYEIAARQVFVPGLAALLPTQTVRVGDSWRIPRKAVQVLLAEPEIKGDALRGKFTELRRPATGLGMQAVFTVTGSIVTRLAETLVNVEVVFTFAPPQATPADAVKKSGLSGDDSLVDVRGAITGLYMGRVAKGLLSEGGKPFRVEQQLVLERRLGGAGPLVRGEVPPSTPAATEANSWLTYLDPRGRFTFRHPQDLLPPPRLQAGTESLFLARASAEGRDLLQIDIVAARRDPQILKDLLKARWDQMQSEVLRGGEEWLPSAEWSGAKVFRLEAAVKPPARGPRVPRVHFDAYLIQFSDQASVIAIATTTKDAVPGFRREVEQVLKTFRPLIDG